MAEWAQFCEERDVKYYFMEGNQWQNSDTSAWANLHSYLNSKIGWDNTCDVNQLTKNFFENFYGPASEVMYELFSFSRVHTAYLKENFSNYGGSYSCEVSTLKEKFWPKQLLIQWIELYKDAYASIEFLKEDEPELYKEYYERIAIEEASPLYMILSMYQGELSDEIVNDYKNSFYSITSQLDFIGNGGNTLAKMWTSFGIAY
jgi:hypothetical protein